MRPLPSSPMRCAERARFAAAASRFDRSAEHENELVAWMRVDWDDSLLVRASAMDRPPRW